MLVAGVPPLPAPLVNTVVCLVGAPASGKSSLARALCDALPRVLLIEADLFRAPDATSPHAIDRAAALAALRAQLQDDQPSPRVVVFDDTNEYRSMRREVWRAVRDARHWAYVAVYVPVPLETALVRNAQRPLETCVPEASVRAVWQRLEPPTQRGWDTAVVVQPEQDALRELCAHWPRVLPPAAQPVAPAPHSAGHELDLALRREIGMLMAPQPSPALAQCLNKARKEILLDRASVSVEEAVAQLRSIAATFVT